MKKMRCSFCLDEETKELIDRAAVQNNISRSAVIRMFLELANYLPVDCLKMTSPIPGLLGIKGDANHAVRT